MSDNTVSKKNLTKIEKNLAKVLKLYEAHIQGGIEFKIEGLLTLTPEKPNTARTIVTVGQGDYALAKMYAILFLPGDGTGDANTYKPGQLIVPEYLQFEDKPERILPRKKDCEKEIFLPFFSVINGKFHNNVVSLEELTVDDVQNPKTIVKYDDLGDSAEKYGNMLNGMYTIKREPFCRRTTGYDEESKRFGDPHAIYHRKELESMQMVGFISLEKGNPLIKIFNDLNERIYST